MRASEKTKFLSDNRNSVLIIHYSCQNLNDNNEGYSPRITSIAVLHLGSSTMKSFSIHLVAEIERIVRDEIDEHYDKIESKMLDEFYEFVKDHQDHYWIHWNMENINYGFETLEHRYRVLTSKIPPKVEESRRYNLSALISAIYGNNFVDHPKMPNLMEINGGKYRDFLTGKEEVEAFERKEYLKLHKSTMCKVYFFKSIFHKLKNRKLKTKHSNFPAKINRIAESPIAKLLGLIAVLYSIFQIGIRSVEYYSSQNNVKENKSIEHLESNKNVKK